ncbi:[protein ADP-ribosylglutamate] hydrolase [Archaeoglobus profundus]|uniref:Appr-1-p processing domain protein n=1 Tax=Archaeoglobus profundus (strain DSM 5631 / JCM 9629 / NBRC 100127 / Av18) TaxID=572546 RepID=D2RH24_ARCPA|nr:[protein ADP-ribosylglutamate] hydrolase [Archaeoglobus profundus]ADB57599.1 Appr-1-p processing domain protein [Archaeoglobus profundus DSM 5631]
MVVKKFGSVEVVLEKGDITKYPAEAIVNAANKYLEHGGGVALAIAKACAGDPQKYTEISKKALKEQLGKDYMDHGEVVVTPALNLEKIGIKYVIHTVGPICGGRWNNEFEEKLYKAFIAPLEKAEELKLKSIAFPAVSAGIYGCPLENVVETFLKAVKDFSEKANVVKKVALVIFGDEDFEVAKRVFEMFPER